MATWWSQNGVEESRNQDPQAEPRELTGMMYITTFIAKLGQIKLHCYAKQQSKI